MLCGGQNYDLHANHRHSGCCVYANDRNRVHALSFPRGRNYDRAHVESDYDRDHYYWY